MGEGADAPTLLREAVLYDCVHRGNPGDVAFYRAHCRGAGSVLELGCGSGRVLLDLGDGIARRVGLDRHRGLLELARRRDEDRRVAWLRTDMRGFELGAAFDRILVPYNGLYCLLGEAELLECLRGIARHLAADGRLVFDIYDADDFHAGGGDEGGGDEEREGASASEEEPLVSVELEAEHGLSTQPIDVFERTTSQPHEQRLEAVYEYRLRGGAEVARIVIPQRYLLAHQIGPLLERAGLVACELYADPSGVAMSLADYLAEPTAVGWLGVVARRADAGVGFSASR